MNNAKAFLCLNKKLPIILSYRGALHRGKFTEGQENILPVGKWMH